MKKLVLLSFCSFLLSACGGGGNGDGIKKTTPDGQVVDLTHNELANLFVNRLNADSRYRVELAKDSTLKNNFVVIYDKDLDEYEAINISGYDPTLDDAADFFEANGGVYINLDKIAGHWESEVREVYDYDCDCYIYETYNETYVPTRYEDWRTGYVFEKVVSTPKDRLKLAAMQETLDIESGAKTLQAQFGMSQKRSFEVSKLALIWQKTPKDRMTDKDHDQFAQEVLGHTITEYKQAITAKSQGKSQRLDDLILETAEFNGINAEHIHNLVNSIIK